MDTYNKHGNDTICSGVRIHGRYNSFQHYSRDGQFHANTPIQYAIVFSIHASRICYVKNNESGSGNDWRCSTYLHQHDNIIKQIRNILPLQYTIPNSKRRNSRIHNKLHHTISNNYPNIHNRFNNKNNV